TKNFKETKEAEKAASELKKLKSNSKIMDMVNRAKADKEANGWLDVARICRQYGDKEDAIKYYERIIKKYAETDAGRFARSEIAPLKKLKKSADDEEEDEDQGSDNGKAKEKDKAKAKDKGKAKPEKEQEKKKEKKEKEEGDEDEGDEESGGE
ncbi:MAG TPA: tetratricopeptide repeat protein, partial [Phycisphaerae bacterium]|nr:tetratricopeptide repeat protein [Phycisphaerae bacterium]